MHDVKTFFQYVIPSVLSFALLGIYTIVDGFFVGNSIGDLGLSAVNIAYPIVAVIQALGTGSGMGGAIYYSINKAEKKDAEAKEFTADAQPIQRPRETRLAHEVQQGKPRGRLCHPRTWPRSPVP